MLGDKRVAFEEVTWLAETHLEDGAAFERRNQEPLYKACHLAERVSPTRWATAEFQSLAYIRGTCACFVEHLLAFCEPLFQDKWRCFLVCFFLKKKKERERESKQAWPGSTSTLSRPLEVGSVWERSFCWGSCPPLVYPAKEALQDHPNKRRTKARLEVQH